MNTYSSFTCSLQGIRHVFCYFSSSSMTFGICIEIWGRRDAKRSYDHLIKGILRNSEQKSWALGVTAEARKVPSSRRNKLLEVAVATLATRAPFGKCGQGPSLGDFPEVAELDGGWEPVITEVIPQAHLGLDIKKTDSFWGLLMPGAEWGAGREGNTDCWLMLALVRAEMWSLAYQVPWRDVVRVLSLRSHQHVDAPNTVLEYNLFNNNNAVINS